MNERSKKSRSEKVKRVTFAVTSGSSE